MLKKGLILLLPWLILLYPASAQNSEVGKTYTTAWLGSPIEIDGKLDEGAWDQVEWGGDFVGHRPEYMVAPSQKTQFKILYDARFIYVAIRAFDTEPEKIERRMTRRDGFDGDRVSIMFDSYYDKRTAFSFTACASGVKGEEYITNNGLLRNEFLNDFKLINSGFLKITNLLPTVSQVLNPVTNGVAIQRGNVYTFKSKTFMLSTAQAYNPGGFGDQHHIMSATLSPNLSVFHTHPAKALSEKGALSLSPGYWVGNGRMPHSVQHENVNLSIYYVDGKKGFMESSLVFFTHAYFPFNKFDEAIIEGNQAFGRKGKGAIALTSLKALHYADSEKTDLIQDGHLTYWITQVEELAQASDFSSFVEKVKEQRVEFDAKNKRLIVKTAKNNLDLIFGGDFSVDGQVQNFDYGRHESDYARISGDPKLIQIEYAQETLILDFFSLQRRFN